MGFFRENDAYLSAATRKNMTSLDVFLKDQGFRLIRMNDEIILERKKKFNVTSIIVGGVSIFILLYVGYMLPPATVLMYIIAAIVLLVVLRFNYRGSRPLTVFNWSHNTMVKKSVWFFVNSKTTTIEGYEGIDIKTVDWQSQSSEGVDEFQKTIYLKTKNGDIRVQDFYTEEEETEPELKELMQIIHEHLEKKPA
jgi:hypothetical protein